jgi:hypothetical protein
MPVTTLRLDEKDLRRIRQLARDTHRDQSSVARDLLNSGWQMYMLKLYRAGKISLGYLAKELDLTVGEAMDLLTDLGIPSNFSIPDLISGFETLARPRARR